MVLYEKEIKFAVKTAHVRAAVSAADPQRERKLPL